MTAAAEDRAEASWVLTQTFGQEVGWLLCQQPDGSEAWARWPDDMDLLGGSEAVAFGIAETRKGRLRRPRRSIAVASGDPYELLTGPWQPSLLVSTPDDADVALWLLTEPVDDLASRNLGLGLAQRYRGQAAEENSLLPLRNLSWKTPAPVGRTDGGRPKPRNLFRLAEGQHGRPDPKRYHPDSLASVLDLDPEFEAEVEEAMRRERVKAEARRRRDSTDLRFPEFRHSLLEELERFDEPLEWAIEGIHPHGGNSLLVSEYKAGKTTLVLNLMRSLADGCALFGEHDVATTGLKRVAWLNFELGDNQARHWVRDLAIENLDRAAMVSLRGLGLPLQDPEGFAWYLRCLRAVECDFMIVDPLAAWFTGDENSNQEMGDFLRTLDRLKVEAGVSNLLLVHHTGRKQQDGGRERSRGAARLDDWADVRWVLQRNRAVRSFSAEGRDVSTGAPRALVYEPDGRRLSYATPEDSARMAQGHRDARKRTDEQRILAALIQTPGLSAAELREAVPMNTGRRSAAVRLLIEQGAIRVEGDGPRRRHFAAGGVSDDDA